MPNTIGLYALKPWYARRLEPVLRRLETAGVSPDALSAAGVVAAVAAGAVLAFRPAGVLSALAVTGLVAARLACANLDGNLARRTGRSRPWGGVVNEVGDRVADLALLAGLAPHVGAGLGVLVLLAASGPSWIALAGAANGASRINGGPVGKTERGLLAVIAALTGFYSILAWIVVAGSVVTVALRARQIHQQLDGRVSA